MKQNTKKQRWDELDSRVLKEKHRVDNYLDMIKRIRRNHQDISGNERYAHLRDLNNMGTHLSDPVYQKLDRVRRDNVGDNYFIKNALTRIGNRTMTQEEYDMLCNVPGENLVDYQLNEELKN